MIGLGIAVRWLHLACGLALVGLVAALLLAGRSDRPTALAWEAHAELVSGAPAAYVCRGFTCLAPVTTTGALREALVAGWTNV